MEKTSLKKIPQSYSNEFPEQGCSWGSPHNTTRHITVDYQTRNKDFIGLKRGKTNDIQSDNGS